ncbi:hypothetical protein [Streptomyces sp. YGL11-2]
MDELFSLRNRQCTGNPAQADGDETPSRIGDDIPIFSGVGNR